MILCCVLVLCLQLVVCFLLSVLNLSKANQLQAMFNGQTLEWYWSSSLTILQKVKSHISQIAKLFPYVLFHEQELWLSKTILKSTIWVSILALVSTWDYLIKQKKIKHNYKSEVSMLSSSRFLQAMFYPHELPCNVSFSIRQFLFFNLPCCCYSQNGFLPSPPCCSCSASEVTVVTAVLFFQYRFALVNWLPLWGLIKVFITQSAQLLMVTTNC